VHLGDNDIVEAIDIGCIVVGIDVQYMANHKEFKLKKHCMYGDYMQKNSLISMFKI